MKIIDPQGKYILEVDTKRCIVYEKPMSYWRSEDIDRLHSDYKEYVVPIFRNAFRVKDWAKIVDLREYKLSMISDDLNDHVRWASKNGYSMGVVLLDKSHKENSAIELQMKLSARDISVGMMICYELDEAYKWLEEQGF